MFQWTSYSRLYFQSCQLTHSDWKHAVLHHLQWRSLLEFSFLGSRLRRSSHKTTSCLGWTNQYINSPFYKRLLQNITPYVTEEVTRNWVWDNFLSSNHCTTMAHSCPCVTVNSPVPPPLWLWQGHCRMGEVEPGGTCRSHGWWKDPLCWTSHPVEMREGITLVHHS